MARARRFSYRQLIASMLVGAFMAWLVCLGAIAYWSRSSDEGPADAIVVLGAAQYGGRPSPVLKARLDHALGLWRSERAPWVVLTGGRRPGDLISEAAAGRRYLVRRGVPNQTVRLEQNGRTSLASMQGASDLLHALRDSLDTVAQQGGKSSRAPLAERPRVLLVSDPFHMLRLDLLARLHGLQPMTSPTRTSPISANRAVLEYMVRESIALPTDVALMLWLKATGREVAQD
jgi:vancomycin permeability regulator SanA